MSIEKFGGRKFILSCAILFFTFLLLLINRLPAEEYLKIVFTIIGLYTGTNVYQKIKLAKPVEENHIKE